MQNLIIDNTFLILLLPLWIFLIIMAGRFFAVYVKNAITYILTLVSSFIGIALCWLNFLNIENPVDWSLPFITIEKFSVNFGLHIDKLSLIFAMVLFTVSFVVQIFSISYMKDESKNYRFFALMNLFNFGMCFMLFSPNLFQLYVFWEMIGIVSYLLIGFDYENQVKSYASKRVFLINRVGDTALFAGIVITSYFMLSYSGNYSFTALFFEDVNTISTLLMAYTTTPVFLTICGLFILSAFVKSAQFPFHTWLQDAMEAKIPVSALLHSATMVAAGVYLIIRLEPFFVLAPILMKIIAICGAVTAVICSIFAFCENNPKKVLAYSTSANLGIMFFALGIGNIKAAIILFAAHAFIKAMLFLLLPKEDNTMSYASFSLFVIGALSLAGIILSGFSAKELLYAGMSGMRILPKVLWFVSFLAACYITRLCFILKSENELIKKVNYCEFMPAFLLIILNIGLYLRFDTEPSVLVLFETAGILFAFITFSISKKFKNFDIFEIIYNKVLPFMYGKFANFADYIDNKIFAGYKPWICLAKINVKLVDWIEINIMNKAVECTAKTVKAISKYDMCLQNKNVQSYNAYALILVTIVVTMIIVAYMFIMKLMS